MARRSAPLLLGVLLACGGDRTPTTVQVPTVAAITISETSATIPVGTTIRLTATPRDAAGQALTGIALAWSSSDTLVAPVSGSGEVRALAPGLTTVIVSTQGREAKAEVTVPTPPPADPVPASIAVTPAAVTVSVGRTAQLTAVVRDSVGTALAGYEPTWTSSDEAVAGVGPTGELFGRRAGTAVVTAAVGDLRATAQVTVPSEAAHLDLLPTSAAITLGGRLQLLGRFTDALGNPISGQVSAWSSSDPDRLSVSATGEVRALSSAFATITASGVGVSATAQVIVREAMSFDSLSIGISHGCGLADGAAHCWGSGYDGQLGNGASGYEATRTAPVPVVGGLRFRSIAAGGAHTCALTAAGEAYCWGSNTYGELGAGSFDAQAHPAPVRVAGSLTFTGLSAGGSHTCGLTSAGAAYCWGYNQGGRLGDGTTTDRAVPVLVLGGHLFTSIVAGGTHTCALMAGGQAYCWGFNHLGQIGDGTQTERLQPVAVAGALQFTAISADLGTCGVVAGGAAYCWGVRPGSPSETVVAVRAPEGVEGAVSWSRIEAGQAHVCGVSTGGDAYCWGGNEAGQLGDGTTDLRVLPTPVVGGLAFTRLDASSEHTCGLTTGKEVYCWGVNYAGVLGNGVSEYGMSAAPLPVVRPRP